MIKIVNVFASADGKTFQTVEEAKVHEINCLQPNTLEIGEWILDHIDQLIEICEAKPDAAPKRKPRSDKGTSRKKPAVVPNGA